MTPESCISTSRERVGGFSKVTIVVLAILIAERRMENKVNDSSFPNLLPLASFKDVVATFLKCQECCNVLYVGTLHNHV